MEPPTRQCPLEPPTRQRPPEPPAANSHRKPPTTGVRQQPPETRIPRPRCQGNRRGRFNLDVLHGDIISNHRLSFAAFASPAYLGSANPNLRGPTNKNRNTRIKNKMAQSSLKKSPSIPPLSAIKKHLLMSLRNHESLCLLLL